MTEFANAAFPWIAMGLAVAISLAYFNSKEKTKVLKGITKGENVMSRLIDDLKGQKCLITCDNIQPSLIQRNTIVECQIIDVDDEWVKINFIDKKDKENISISKTTIIRIENILNIEIIT